jgi:phosphatidate cytidylyltransferase
MDKEDTKKSTNSLKLRVISAFVLIPIVLAAMIYGGYAFLGMIVLAGAISLYEWLNMARLAPSPLLHKILGCAYIILCFLAFAAIRLTYSDGLGLSLLLLLSVWASDSGAYFAGKTIGGAKMAPTISPNKTWAGLIGGVVSSAAVFAFYAQYAGPVLSDTAGLNLHAMEVQPLWILAITGAFITVAGQTGDLLISKEKRLVGVKDTGHLIPGHGGILDRIDSLLLCSPVFLLILMLLGL